MSFSFRARQRAVAASAVLAGAALVVAVPESSIGATTAEGACNLPPGILKKADLPDGSSVNGCKAFGRVMRDNGLGVTIPAAGEGVHATAIRADGSTAEFGVRVTEDGAISYETSEEQHLVAGSVSSGSPSSCEDDTYILKYWKEYGTWDWYIGDGGKPAGLTTAAAKDAYVDSINNMTQTTNTCNYTDQVDASASYKGTTTLEADINSESDCTAKDDKSTVDGGNLKWPDIAVTCTFTRSIPGVKDDNVQSDIRFNTTDFDFVDGVSGCTNQHDLRSIMTHEVGHVFGMADVYGDHAWLTMSGTGGACQTRARTLAKGDVLGMRALY